ncbi:hypothetical protein M2390_000884 [Mycetocola sp. BIGb0189]|uniref:hypothetical protein n=1 Tax=Mycetocola sp. BIGb0189 TaxID=2940604 RepID=UPI002167B7F3|nr:hypothetical protein [Mycetocola sp. BIGb0189]MCS4275723.1 hypothetical protein [Mycetocola sp. BIGb0189]
MMTWGTDRILGNKSRRRDIFWWLTGILAASGIAMAFIAASGVFDSVGYSLVWRVFTADLYLIASLAAQHVWLRRSIWVGTAATLAIGLINTFAHYIPAGAPARFETRSDRWFGVEQDVEVAANIIVITLIVLGFISLAYRWLAEDSVLRGTYVATFCLIVLGMLLTVIDIIDSPSRWGISQHFGQIQSGVFILAFTGAAIVTIGGFFLRKSALGRMRDESVRAAALAAAKKLVPVPPSDPGTVGITAGEDELRALVRKYVDEYLAEREQFRHE